MGSGSFHSETVKHTIERLWAIHGTKPFKAVTVRRLFWRIGWATTHGYLSLEDNGDYWTVFLTSDRDHHIAFTPAYAMDITKATGELHGAKRRQRTSGSSIHQKPDGGWTGVYRSAISLWPEYNPQHARGIYHYVSELLVSVAKQTPAYSAS